MVAPALDPLVRAIQRRGVKVRRVDARLLWVERIGDDRTTAAGENLLTSGRCFAQLGDQLQPLAVDASHALAHRGQLELALREVVLNPDPEKLYPTILAQVGMAALLNFAKQCLQLIRERLAQRRVALAQRRAHDRLPQTG
jgi:hypothetical protein